MKKNVKNIIALVLVLLVIGIFVGAIFLSSDPDRAKKPEGDTPPIVDPDDPDHDYKWEMKTGDSEYHWYEAECTDHKGLIKSGSKEAHEFIADKDDEKNERCKVCGYKRPIPTKQEDLNISFGDDGASVGKPDEDKKSIPDLVIPGTVVNPEGEEIPVVEIEDEAYKDNQSLSTLVILNGVKIIGKEAFKGCPQLKEITIPKTVEYIDPEAFKNCESLEKIHIDKENSVYRELGYCVIRIEDKCLILGCKGSTIPNANFNAVTSISEYAFCGSGIETLTIPDNITSIGAYAFRECKYLRSISLPNNTANTTVREYTFYECSALTTVTFGNAITHIGNSAFAGCKVLDNIVLPSSVQTIADRAFNGCEKLKTITLNDGLTGIGKYAFSGCTGLESITLPKTVMGIGSSAFEGCTKLTSIIYAGTAEQWENVTTSNNWKPEGVDVTFETQPETSDGTDEDNQN